jgi:hypothetical protein
MTKRNFAHRLGPDALVVLVAAASTGCWLVQGDDAPTPRRPVADSGAPGAGTSNPTADGGGGGGGSATDGGDPAGDGGDAGAVDGGPSDSIVGNFTLVLLAETPASNGSPETPASASLLGMVYDGFYPPTRAWTTVEQASGCTLYTPRVPNCSPACDTAAACVDTNKCVPFPKAQDVGTVQVKGLGTSPFSMNAVSGSYKPSSLPYPPCAQGADIRLDAAGGPYTPFTLQSKCIQPLDFPGPVQIQTGQPLKLTWTAGQAEVGRIQIRIDLSPTGTVRGKIECDVADNGSLEIPAEMVTKLVGLGASGFSQIVMSRVASGSASIAPGRVVFTMSSGVQRVVQVPGVTSCNDSTPCPSGQTCQTNSVCK